MKLITETLQTGNFPRQKLLFGKHLAVQLWDVRRGSAATTGREETAVKEQAGRFSSVRSRVLQ